MKQPPENISFPSSCRVTRATSWSSSPSKRTLEDAYLDIVGANHVA